MHLKHLTRPFEVKEISDDGHFTGYGSIFGNIDSYRDVVQHGAFANDLKDKKASDVKLLWQHDRTQPIGVYKSMYEDSKGLVVEGQLLVEDIQRAREARALMKAGAISGLSIGYDVAENGEQRKDGVNYLSELKLWEISIVTFPANTLATVSTIKSAHNIKTIREFEELLREVGFSQARAKHIASCGFKNYESEQTDEQRDVVSDDELLSAITHLKNSISGATHELKSRRS